VFFDRLIEPKESSPFFKLAEGLGFKSAEQSDPVIVSEGRALRNTVKDLILHETVRILAQHKEAVLSGAAPIVVDHSNQDSGDTFFSESGIVTLVDLRVRNVNFGNSPMTPYTDFSSYIFGPEKLQLVANGVVSMVTVNKVAGEVETETFPIYTATTALNSLPQEALGELKGVTNQNSPVQNIYVKALKEAMAHLKQKESKLELLRTEFTKMDDQGVFVLVNGKRLDVDFVPLLGAERNQIVPIQCLVHRRGIVLGQASTPKILVLAD
jgi:hypothetical protein